MSRNAVIVLDLVLGLIAIGGGIYLLAGAPRLSKEWLRNTPFQTYLWPGIVTLVLVGGSLLAAALLLLGDARLGRLVSVEAGVLLVGLTAAQLASVGYRHWLQLVALAAGLAVLGLSLALPSPG
jgi:hypothetical protein